MLKLVVFAALLGLAFILDSYLEKSQVEIAGKNTQKGHDAGEHDFVYFVTQSSTTPSAKTSVQKVHDRKFFQQSHDKLIQKYHQHRNYQLLKQDAENSGEPLILPLHFLVSRNYIYSSPDDVPLIS